MSMNMAKDDFKFNPYVQLTKLTEEEIELYTKTKHKDNNASKFTKTPTGSIQQECLENLSTYTHKTTIVHTTTTVVHTSWQSSVQKLRINVEATNSAGNNTEQETRIKTMPQGALFSSNMENFNGNEYVCKICHASFDHFDEFLFHKNLMHTSQPYECNVCNAQFSLRVHLNEHRAKHDNHPCMRNSSVNLAVTKTSSETTSHNHRDIFNNVSNSSSKLHQCNLCNKSFKTHLELNGHLRDHTDGNKRILRSQLTLDKNKMKNQNKNSSAVISEENVFPNVNVNKSYKCKDCNRDFTTRTELNIHYKQHKQQMICNVCHKTFVLKRNFEKHLLSHTNVIMSNDISNNTSQKQQKVIGSVKRKTNTLNVQTKTSKRTKSEKSNILLNEKLFQCLYCNKYCKSKRSLGQHKRQNHSGTELPHQNRKSKTTVVKKAEDKSGKQNLTLNEKSFQCLYCNKYCKSKRSLGQHKRQNHSRTESPVGKQKSETVVSK